MKNKDIQSQIKKFEKEVNVLRNIFIKKYFGNIDEYDFWWICDEIGGTLSINDYFFDLKRILDILRLNVSKKNMFDYYEEELELAMKDEEITNLQTWLKNK